MKAGRAPKARGGLHVPSLPALSLPKGSRGVIILALLFCGLAAAAAAQQSHLIVVSGLGGADEYRDRFHEWSVRLVDGAVERHGIPAEQVVYLAERPERDPERIRARSTWENVQAAIADVGERAAAGDVVFIVLIGHGSFSGGPSQFNVPGPDPSVADFTIALEELNAQRVVFINTTSASGEFIAGLSGENRTIITATKTARERNETKFGGFLVDAIAGPAAAPPPPPVEAEAGARIGATVLMPDGAVDSLPTEAEAPTAESDAEAADMNKDGRLSLLEMFNFARQEVARVYERDGLLLTEHAMIDDNGDGEGSEEPDPIAVGADGRMAQTIFFAPASERAAARQETDDPALLAAYEARDEIQERIAAHQMLKDAMEPAVYTEELERLFVELALKNREIRDLEAKVPQP